MKLKCKPTKAIRKEFYFSLPTLELIQSGSVLVLCFKDVYSLQQALHRTHIQYEGSILKGPLRGINIPLQFYLSWLKIMYSKTSFSSIHLNSKDELHANELALLRDISQFFTKSENEFDTEKENGEEPSLDEKLILYLELIPSLHYIIGYIKGDKSTLIHEISHATYFMHSNYRNFVSECYSNLSAQVLQYINKELLIRGYKEDVYQDEFQA